MTKGSRKKELWLDRQTCRRHRPHFTDASTLGYQKANCTLMRASAVKNTSSIFHSYPKVERSVFHGNKACLGTSMVSGTCATAAVNEVSTRNHSVKLFVENKWQLGPHSRCPC
jgi:hypothetical protein